MMVQSKITVKDNDENGVGASKRRSIAEVDHWAFLEEFEAPMWADLSLESTLITEDNDDAWFHTSHPFHHHSARRLRSAFAHPDVGNDLFNFNLQGAYSPQLPSSVSKSRGKNYRIRDWRSNCRRVSLNKTHPINDLGGRMSRLNTVLSQECKTKVNRQHQSEASSSITGVVDDSERRVALNSQAASTSGVSTSTATTVSGQQDSKVLRELKEAYSYAGGLTLNTQFPCTSGVSTSTLTSVSWQQDSKVSGEPKEAFGHAGGLLNALRTNLRKSRATRPALRVEISDDREVKGHKSSVGKSSVGSSSAGNGSKGKGSVVPKVHCCKQESKGRKSSTGKSSVDSSSTGYDTKGHESSSGKSSVVSSSIVYDTKGKGSKVMPKADHCRQVKVENNVNLGLKGHNTSFGRPNLGFSNPKTEVKKMAADFKPTKARNPNVSDLRNRVNPVNGRVKAKKVSEASVCARNAYSFKIDKDAAPAQASSGQEASKSKVLLQTSQKIPLNQSRFAQGISQFNEFACSGKVNPRGKAVLSRRSGDKENVAVKVSNHKAPKLKSKNKVGVTSIGSKARMGRMNDGIVSLDTRVYLR